MKDYYAILQVRREANAAEIKRSYRRLAIQFHPDKNPEASAEHVIKEINEAYEVLSNPTQKTIYDERFSHPDIAETLKSETSPAHRDPAYRRKKPNVRYKSERERMFEMMTYYFPVAMKIIYVALGVSLILMIDFLLPSSVSEEVVISIDIKRSYSRRNTTSWWVIHTDKKNSIKLPYKFSDHFQQGTRITVFASPILNIAQKVETIQQAVEIRRSIYGSFLFAPVTLLLVSLFGIYFKNRIDYAFNAGVVSFMILCLTLIIYLIIHLI